MARLTLQIKNVATLLLSAGASICSAITVRKVFQHGSWAIPATGLAVTLGTQLTLGFIESKEEEELSLIRRQRLERIQHAINERRVISERIEYEAVAGSPEAVERWQRLRRQSDDERSLDSQ